MLLNTFPPYQACVPLHKLSEAPKAAGEPQVSVNNRLGAPE